MPNPQTVTGTATCGEPTINLDTGVAAYPFTSPTFGAFSVSATLGTFVVGTTYDVTFAPQHPAGPPVGRED